MKSKTKIILAVVLGLLVISIVLGVYFSSKGTFQGSAVNSISKIDFESAGEPFFNQPLFVYTFTQNIMSQSAKGLLVTPTASQYSGELPADFKVTKSFSIDTEYANQECIYNINRLSQGSSWVALDANPLLYRISEVRTSKFSVIYEALTSSHYSDCATACGSATPIAAISPRYSLYAYCACGTTIASSVGAKLQDADVHIKATIKLNIDGTTYPLTIDNLNQDKVGGWLLNGVAYANWLGNLETGVSCKAPVNRQPVFYLGKWSDMDEARYGSYKAALKLFATPSNLDAFRNAISKSDSTALAVEQSIQAKTTSGIETNGKFIQPISDYIQKPQIQVYIKAESIGIYQPVAKFVIESASSACFETGVQGKISVNIRNDGKERGCASIDAICPSGFKPTKTELCLSAGQKGSATISMAAEPNIKSELKGSCTVSVQPAIGTALEKAVDVCVTAPCTCSPFTESCTGKDRVRCDANCMTYTILETCPKSCTISGMLSKCEDVTTTCEINADCNDKNICTKDTCSGVFSKECKYEFDADLDASCGGKCVPLVKLPEGFLGWTMLPALSAECVKTLDLVKLFMSLIIAGFAIYLLNKGFEKRKILSKKNAKKIARPIIYIIVGLVTYAVSYQLIWYGIIAIIIVAVLAGAFYLTKKKLKR